MVVSICHNLKGLNGMMSKVPAIDAQMPNYYRKSLTSIHGLMVVADFGKSGILQGLKKLVRIGLSST